LTKQLKTGPPLKKPAVHHLRQFAPVPPAIAGKAYTRVAQQQRLNAMGKQKVEPAIARQARHESRSATALKSQIFISPKSETFQARIARQTGS